MRHLSVIFSLFLIILFACSSVSAKNHQKDSDHKTEKHHHWKKKSRESVSLGPRPLFLVDDMDESRLKRALHQCKYNTL